MNKVTIELDESQADLVVEALNDKVASLNQLASQFTSADFEDAEVIHILAMLKQCIEVVLDKL